MLRWRKLTSVGAWLILLMSGCGSGVPLPVAARGSAGNVLLIDQDVANNAPSSQIWVGFNSQTDLDKVRSALTNQQTTFVEGTIVANSSADLGFYLDPTTTNVPDGFIPELEQHVITISQNPAKFSGQSVVFRIRVAEIE